MSVVEAARSFGITRQAVLKRIRSGRLPATKVGRNYIIAKRVLRPDPGTDDTLAEVVRRLTAAYHPERVYLFGSRSRGDSGPDSDYDIVLVVPDDAPAELLRARRAYEVLWGLGVAVDVLVWRRSAFDARAAVRTSLPAVVLREGVLLHAA
ncbi:MAG: nucleotidyltransferase domain-containing protein [Actinomycetota bacterium]